ncbi:3889_t:CDS:10 [Ambispora gerdemannii]|uniref:3889_t:CDS:1 n=1 Tax=Ambispora gerdemannii TaxID=144530 RepID=A0A9N8VM87_9GLOM|nr:3889_t:CDS:10 [Ambispora gerdemannii]
MNLRQFGNAFKQAVAEKLADGVLSPERAARIYPRNQAANKAAGSTTLLDRGTDYNFGNNPNDNRGSGGNPFNTSLSTTATGQGDKELPKIDVAITHGPNGRINLMDYFLPMAMSTVKSDWMVITTCWPRRVMDNFEEVTDHTTNINAWGVNEFFRDNLLATNPEDKQLDLGIARHERLKPRECQELHRLGYDPEDLFEGGQQPFGAGGNIGSPGHVNDLWQENGDFKSFNPADGTDLVDEIVRDGDDIKVINPLTGDFTNPVGFAGIDNLARKDALWDTVGPNGAHTAPVVSRLGTAAAHGLGNSAAHTDLDADTPENNYIIDQFLNAYLLDVDEAVQAYNNGWIYGLEIKYNDDVLAELLVDAELVMIDNAADSLTLTDAVKKIKKNRFRDAVRAAATGQAAADFGTVDAPVPDSDFIIGQFNHDNITPAEVVDAYNQGWIYGLELRIDGADLQAKTTALQLNYSGGHVQYERTFIRNFQIQLGTTANVTEAEILAYSGKNIDSTQAFALYKGSPQVLGSELSKGTNNDEVKYNKKDYKITDTAGIIAAKKAKMDADAAAAQAAAALATAKTAAENAIKSSQKETGKPEVTDAELNKQLTDNNVLTGAAKTWLDYVNGSGTETEVNSRRDQVLAAITKVRTAKGPTFDAAAARTVAITGVKAYWKTKSNDQTETGTVNSKSLAEEFADKDTQNDIDSKKAELTGKIDAEKAKEPKEEGPKPEKIPTEKIEKIIQTIFGEELKTEEDIQKFLEENVKGQEEGLAEHLEELPDKLPVKGNSAKEKVISLLTSQKSDTVIKVVFGHKLKDENFKKEVETEMENKKDIDENRLNEEIYSKENELPSSISADFALTLALPISHKTKGNPQAVAQEIIKITDCPNLEYTITEQGYINFRFPNNYYQHFFAETLARAGHNLQGKKKDIRINIEYVSANPTGYLHLAHFRHAVIGNTLANVYQFYGYQITREYYINDRGGQITSLINSVYYFYHQLQGVTLANSDKVEYAGNSSREVAQNLIESLYQKKQHLDLVQELKEENLIYNHEGATFFRSSLAGDDKDRVIIKQDSDYTYFFSDILYHQDKLKRADKLINIMGADHHGFINRLKSSCQLLGHKSETIQIILVQIVSLLTKEGDAERFSKRAGNTIELDEALKYIDMNQLKFFLLEKEPNQPLSINAELLKENKEKTRLYYIQYAHARCHQILHKAQEKVKVKE